MYNNQYLHRRRVYRPTWLHPTEEKGWNRFIADYSLETSMTPPIYNYQDNSILDAISHKKEQIKHSWMDIAMKLVNCFPLCPLSCINTLHNINIVITFILILALVISESYIVVYILLAFVCYTFSFGFYHKMRHIYEENPPALAEHNDKDHQFNMLGVEISVLLEFIQTCGGREKLMNLSTGDVCHKHMKTMINGMSYCNHLQSSGDPRVKTANVFISHAWSYEFLHVVDAIVNHFGSDTDGVVIWFDLFSNNQFGLGDDAPPFSWWCHTFLHAIENIGHTLMIVEPWDNPKTLTRSWCLFEIYATYMTGSVFEVAMCESEKARFMKDIANRSDLFYDTISRIDIKHSEAGSAMDKERIYEVVEKSIGFSKLNYMVMQCIRAWFITALEGQVHEMRDDISRTVDPQMDRSEIDESPKSIMQKLVLLRTLANMYRDQGMHEAASDTYVKLREVVASVEIDEHDDPSGDHQKFVVFEVQSLLDWARFMYKVGKYDESLTVLEDCKNTILSLSSHTTLIVNLKKCTFDIEIWLAKVLVKLNRHNDAKLLLDKHRSDLNMLTVKEQDFFGGQTEIDSMTLICELNRLAACVDEIKSDSKNVSCTKNAWVDLKRVSLKLLLDLDNKFGRQHQLTLEALIHFTDVLLLNETVKKEELFNITHMLHECYNTYAVKFGMEHPNTLHALLKLGEYYEMLSEMDEQQRGHSGSSMKTAVDLYSMCYEKSTKVLGDKHPDTLRALKFILCHRRMQDLVRNSGTKLFYLSCVCILVQAVMFWCQFHIGLTVIIVIEGFVHGLLLDLNRFKDYENSIEKKSCANKCCYILSALLFLGLILLMMQSSWQFACYGICLFISLLAIRPYLKTRCMSKLRSDLSKELALENSTIRAYSTTVRDIESGHTSNDTTRNPIMMSDLSARGVAVELAQPPH